MTPLEEAQTLTTTPTGALDDPVPQACRDRNCGSSHLRVPKGVRLVPLPTVTVKQVCV